MSVMQGHYQLCQCRAHFHPTRDSNITCTSYRGKEIGTSRHHRVSLVYDSFPLKDIHQIRIRYQFINPMVLHICQLIDWLFLYMDKRRMVRDKREAFTTEQIHPPNSRDIIHHGKCLFLVSTLYMVSTSFSFRAQKAQGLKWPLESSWSSNIAMPTFLASIATINSALWPNLGIIKNTGAEYILTSKISKATLVATECATR